MQASAPAFDRDFPLLPGKADRVSDRVTRVLAPNPSAYTFTGTVSYIVGAQDVAVIDPGPADEAHLNALMQALQGRRVKHILVTHSHRDHYPLADRLQQLTNAPICGFGADAHFTPDRNIADGETLSGPDYTLTALHTPGHMWNHLCFRLAEENALFSGDHVMTWSTSIIAPPEGDMAHFMASLRKVMALKPAVLYPGHGPQKPAPQGFLRALLTHRRMREAAILGQVQAGLSELEAITRAVYPALAPELFPGACLSARAHLEHLAAKGQIALQTAASGAALYLPRAIA
jgi:glyoxylase-like metal-dependent hydrolase (beta-lactamase superfamily II)